MNWFPGTIAEAVNVSKAKNAIFVVYSEGKLNTSCFFFLLSFVSGFVDFVAGVSSSKHVCEDTKSMKNSIKFVFCVQFSRSR